MTESRRQASYSGSLCLLYRHCDSEGTMARRIIGFWEKVVLMVVALCLTVSGINIQCGVQEQDAFMDCISPHLLSFFPLTVGSFCNRSLITEELCQKFATVVRCVNNINTSSTCRRDAATQIKQQINVACNLDDLREVCTEAPALDTGEVILTTTSSSKAVENRTTESSSAAVTGQTIESTSARKDENSFNGIGGGSIPQASMILLMIHKMMLTLVM